MLNVEQAKMIVEKKIDGCKVHACVPYKGGYLARVEYPSAEEAHYDPFFMVNAHTGDVAEFSIMSDGNPSEVSEAFKRGERR